MPGVEVPDRVARRHGLSAVDGRGQRLVRRAQAARVVDADHAPTGQPPREVDHPGARRPDHRTRRAGEVDAPVAGKPGTRGWREARGYPVIDNAQLADQPGHAAGDARAEAGSGPDTATVAARSAAVTTTRERMSGSLTGTPTGGNFESSAVDSGPPHLWTSHEVSHAGSTLCAWTLDG